MNDTHPLPPDFLHELGELYPQFNLDDWKNCFSPKQLKCFRINTLKTTHDLVFQSLSHLSLEYLYDDAIRDVFFVNINSELLLTDLVESGMIVAQSISSMIAPKLLDIHKSDQILDLCAAPGSKTCQMAALKGGGEGIMANDPDRARVYKLKSMLALLGVEKVKIVSADGRSLWKEYQSNFDKVLVDVPCSMEGRFVWDDPKTFSHWSRKKVKNLSKLQRFLLKSGFSCLKVGGTLVYSTCTLSKKENEDVVNWFLDREGNSAELLSTSRSKSYLSEYLSKLGMKDDAFKLVGDGAKNISDTNFLENCMRILPSPFTEGFFLAVFAKKSRD